MSKAKSHTVTIRLTDEVFETLNYLCKFYGYSKQEYLVHAITRVPIYNMYNLGDLVLELKNQNRCIDDLRSELQLNGIHEELMDQLVLSEAERRKLWQSIESTLVKVKSNV